MYAVLGVLSKVENYLTQGFLICFSGKTLMLHLIMLPSLRQDANTLLTFPDIGLILSDTP